MFRFRFLPFRYFLYCIPLIFLLITSNQIIFHLLFFNPHATDLAGVDGVALKHSFLVDLMKLDNSLFYYGFYQSFLFPILNVIVAYLYHSLKQKHLKYLIGRGKDYSKALLTTKLYLASGVVFVFLFVLLTLIFLATAVHKQALSQLEPYFSPHSILAIFSRHTYLYLIYYTGVKSMALFLNAFFICYLVDYYQHFIKAALVYLIFLWALAPILYSFLPFYLVPMTSIMITSYGDISLPLLLAPYLSYLLFYIYTKARMTDEVS